MEGSINSRYFKRIDRVLARLQQAIMSGEDPPALTELASVAGLSSYHFHRIYRAMTGETIGRTAGRLRMLRALHLLGDGHLSITAIALAVGYDTSQAFARAFREQVGRSPSQLRESSTQRAPLIARLSRPPAGSAGDKSRLVIDVVSIEPFEVVLLRNVGAFSDLDQGFNRLFDWAGNAGLAEGIRGLYGLPLTDHRDTPPALFEFDCALLIQADPEVDGEMAANMHRLQVHGGTFIRSRHVGAYEGIEDHVDRVLAQWRPDSGTELRDAPIHYHFLDDPEQVPEALLRADIYLPTQAARA